MVSETHKQRKSWKVSRKFLDVNKKKFLLWKICALRHPLAPGFSVYLDAMSIRSPQRERYRQEAQWGTLLSRSIWAVRRQPLDFWATSFCGLSRQCREDVAGVPVFNWPGKTVVLYLTDISLTLVNAIGTLGYTPQGREASEISPAAIHHNTWHSVNAQWTTARGGTVRWASTSIF